MTQPAAPGGKKPRKIKLFISRLRQPDGTWIVDPTPTTRKEAKRSEQFNRILGGIITQVWPLEDAKKAFPELAEEMTACEQELFPTKAPASANGG